MFLVHYLGIFTSEYAWENKNVQKFIHNDNTKFDLIISEQFYQESWLAFAHKYKTPIVTISTFGYNEHMDKIMGLRTQPSFVPQLYTEYSHQMTYCERFWNTWAYTLDSIIRYVYYLPEQNKQIKKYLAHLDKPDDPLPSVYELENQVSITLANTHEVFDPRPLMPGQINVAGINIKKRDAPLPPDIQKFLDEATDGVIYFSWGSVLQSSRAPKERIKIIIDALGNVKQRVLWKYEKEVFDGNLPPNIMIQKWMPQKEILAHPNCILFISHGGLFGSLEGLYNGVPMLYTPFFGDQARNAKRAMRAGYAQALLFNDMNETNFRDVLLEMLSNKKYRENAKLKSLIFQDNIVDPLDKALYWIEYVIRHKGAKHLNSNARNLNYFQYYAFDVYIIIDLLIIGFVLFLYFGLKKLFSKKKTHNTIKNKKTN